MSIQEKREALKMISLEASEIREALLHAAKNDEEIQAINLMTVNQIIVKEIYTNENNTEFHTFKGWLKEGKAVKKGEHAFLIWGRPKEVQEKEANKKGNRNHRRNQRRYFFPCELYFQQCASCRTNSKKTGLSPNPKKNRPVGRFSAAFPNHGKAVSFLGKIYSSISIGSKCSLLNSGSLGETSSIFTEGINL